MGGGLRQVAAVIADSPYRFNSVSADILLDENIQLKMLLKCFEIARDRFMEMVL